MPDAIQRAIEASRHVGAVELTPKPIAAPKVTNIEDTAAATKAPATIGVHCRVHNLSADRSPAD
jgi:hypothetical protein